MRTISNFIQVWFFTTWLNGFIFTLPVSHNKEMGSKKHKEDVVVPERVIRDLSESARKQLLHARAHWPAAVHFALWPYALRNATLLHNSLTVLEDGNRGLSYSAQFK
jgi:hypothetical protein